MIFSQFESFLQNLSFIVLFLVLLFFWIQASFLLNFGNIFSFLKKRKDESSYQEDGVLNYKNKTKKLPSDKNPFLASLGTLGFVIANMSLGLLLVLRGLTNGYFPLTNLYESLMFLSWTFTTLHLILENKSVLPQNILTNQNKQKNILIGVITAPMALFTNAFATFSLPLDMQKSISLVPALQSNWLMMHVTIMILSYGTLLIGCVLSIAFLVLNYFYASSLSFQGGFHSPLQNSSLNEKKPPLQFSNQPQFFSNTFFSLLSSNAVLEKNFLKPESGNSFSLTNEINLTETSLQSFEKNAGEKYELSFSETKNQNLENFHSYYGTLLENIDNLSYRILGIGFPFLTIGILSGAVWANEAWGSYWSWDPKETWALITWLTFACYFHVRIVKGWKGKKPAILATLGFFLIWICYLGVNLLGKGLHSYGWISI